MKKSEYIRKKFKLGNKWMILSHPLTFEFVKRVSFLKKQGFKILIDAMIGDIPHINSQICEVLKSQGIDGVTVLKEIGDLDKINTHGLQLFVLSVEELNTLLES